MTNKNCDLIYGDMNIIDQNNSFLYTYNYRKIYRKEFPCHINNLIGQPSAFWRSSAYKSLNKFDLSFKLASDYDFFAKLIIDKKINFKYYPICFSSFRIHKETLSSNFKEVNLFEVNKIRKRYKISVFVQFLSNVINIFHKINSLFRYRLSKNNIYERCK